MSATMPPPAVADMMNATCFTEQEWSSGQTITSHLVDAQNSFVDVAGGDYSHIGRTFSVPLASMSCPNR
jgi:hypothetical protein